MTCDMELESVNALILAGGLGTRLRSAVPDRPKVLAEVRGRPFLSYLLDRLHSFGITRTVLCTGYLGERIREAYGDTYAACRGGAGLDRVMRLVHSREESPLGTAGAIRHALPFIASDPVLVINGDSFHDADLRLFLARYRARGAKAGVLLAGVPDTSRYGRVETNDDETVSAFVEKGGDSGPGWINAGIYIIGRDLVAQVPAGTAVSLEKEVFPGWIGHGLYGFRSEGRFIDIGTPESYREAEEFFGP